MGEESLTTSTRKARQNLPHAVTRPFQWYIINLDCLIPYSNLPIREIEDGISSNCIFRVTLVNELEELK